jgi:hypothetical protein
MGGRFLVTIPFRHPFHSGNYKWAINLHRQQPMIPITYATLRSAFTRKTYPAFFITKFDPADFLAVTGHLVAEQPLQMDSTGVRESRQRDVLDITAGGLRVFKSYVKNMSKYLPNLYLIEDRALWIRGSDLEDWPGGFWICTWIRISDGFHARIFRNPNARCASVRIFPCHFDMS